MKCSCSELGWFLLYIFINFRKMHIGLKTGSMQTPSFIDFIIKTSMPPLVTMTVSSVCLGSNMHNYQKSCGITKNCHFVPVCYYLITLLKCEMGKQYLCRVNKITYVKCLVQWWTHSNSLWLKNCKWIEKQVETKLILINSIIFPSKEGSSNYVTK